MRADRYFPANEPELRQQLDDYLRGLAGRLKEARFANEVAFLLLAGGYGRGEGGIFRAGEDAAATLYNDLEFYLVLRSGRSFVEAAKWCAEVAIRGEHEIGIEIEFKLLTLSALRGAEPSMFIYDLLAAHRLVFGEAGLVDDLPARLRDASQIPEHEATRLLFNRGTGLFFCREAIEANSELVTNGFVERNHAKTQLALADAVLALNHRYHFSCVVRHDRLGEPLTHKPPNWEQLVNWHEAGVKFKLHPRHEQPSRNELAARQTEIVAAWRELFLWVESTRLGRSFGTAREYAEFRGRLFPESSPAKNWLLHFRDRLRRGRPPRGWFDYPRAALQRALVLLLEPNPAEPQLRRILALSSNASASAKMIAETYRHWWRFYN